MPKILADKKIELEGGGGYEILAGLSGCYENIERENMTEATFVAQRIIKDRLIAAGGVLNHQTKFEER